MLENIAYRLRTVRKKLKLTQDDLADRWHVQRQTISRWENNELPPRLGLIRDAIKLLEIEYEQRASKIQEDLCP